MLAAIRAVVLLLAALVVGAVWLTVPGTQQTASTPGCQCGRYRYDTDWAAVVPARRLTRPRLWVFSMRATDCSKWS